MILKGVYASLLFLMLLQIAEIKGLETTCNNGWNSTIIFNNTIASTAILVEWNPYTNGDIDVGPVYYNISYNYTDSEEEYSILTTENSIILVHLEINTNYCIIICVNGTDKFCSNTFQTFDFGNLTNQVMNVRVHVYKPLLNGDSITAQLIWQQLPQATSYDIRIFTADSSMDMIAEGSFNDLLLQEPFLNIVTRTNMNNLSFPLISDQLYIAQVRESTSSWSEPIWINTANPNPALELFIFAEGGGSLIYELYGDDVLFQEYIYEGKTPFALDKRNRNAFFTIPVSGLYSIWKRNIDDLFMEEYLFKLDNGIVPLAMSYDWIAKKLYVSVRNGTQLMIYYLLDVGDVEDRDMIHVYTSETPISVEFQTEMTINPFKGLLHWTEGNEQGVLLVQYDLEEMNRVVLRTNLRYPTLAQNIEQNCIYTIIIDQTQSINIMSVPVLEQQEDDLCASGFSIPRNLANNNIQQIRITLDETGIYMYVESSDGTNFILYLYYNNDVDLIGDVQLSGFATTSPGTQPLPEKIECLSPNFENESNRPVPEITEKNETSFIITWNTPTVDSNCHSVVVSTPPLIYTVYVNISGDDSIPGFPKTQYSNTLTVSGLNNSVQYIVSISARNEFTLFNTTQEDVADFRGNEVTFSFSQSSSATTTIASFSSLSSTSTSSSPTTITMSTSITSSRPTTTQNDLHIPSSIRSLSDTSTLGNSMSSSSSSSSSFSSTIITPSSSTSTSSTSETSSSTPGPAPGDSSDQVNLALIGGISGVLVFIIVCLIGVITAILCIKKKRPDPTNLEMSHDQRSPSLHQTQRQVDSNSISSEYDYIQMDAEYQVNNNPAYNSILNSTRNGYTSTIEHENSVEQDAEYQVDNNPAYNSILNSTRNGYTSTIEHENSVEQDAEYQVNNNPAYNSILNSILNSTRNGYTSTIEHENSVEQDAEYQVDNNPAYNSIRAGYDAELIYN